MNIIEKLCESKQLYCTKNNYQKEELNISFAWTETYIYNVNKELIMIVYYDINKSIYTFETTKEYIIFTIEFMEEWLIIVDKTSLFNKLTNTQIIDLTDNKDIGELFFVEETTIKSHRRNIMQKLGIKGKVAMNKFLRTLNFQSPT